MITVTFRNFKTVEEADRFTERAMTEARHMEMHHLSYEREAIIAEITSTGPRVFMPEMLSARRSKRKAARR